MITIQRLAFLVLAGSVAALGGALVAQFGFGLHPCELCLAQRVPFVVAGLLAALTLAVTAVHPRLGRALVVVAGLLLLVNAGIAFFHVGVEQKWWHSQCAASETPKLTVADLSALMTKPAEARCDEPAWQWHGITMAGMNIVYSGGLGVLILLGAARTRRRVFR